MSPDLKFNIQSPLTQTWIWRLDVNVFTKSSNRCRIKLRQSWAYRFHWDDTLVQEFSQMRTYLSQICFWFWSKSWISSKQLLNFMIAVELFRAEEWRCASPIGRYQRQIGTLITTEGHLGVQTTVQASPANIFRLIVFHFELLLNRMRLETVSGVGLASYWTWMNHLGGILFLLSQIESPKRFH